jgi:hypothetical protein
MHCGLMPVANGDEHRMIASNHANDEMTFGALHGSMCCSRKSKRGFWVWQHGLSG